MCCMRNPDTKHLKNISPHFQLWKMLTVVSHTCFMQFSTRYYCVICENLISCCAFFKFCIIHFLDHPVCYIVRCIPTYTSCTLSALYPSLHYLCICRIISLYLHLEVGVLLYAEMLYAPWLVCSVSVLLAIT